MRPLLAPLDAPALVFCLLEDIAPHDGHYLMSILSLESDAPCALAALAKAILSLLAQQLLDAAICVKNHTSHPLITAMFPLLQSESFGVMSYGFMIGESKTV